MWKGGASHRALGTSELSRGIVSFKDEAKVGDRPRRGVSRGRESGRGRGRASPHDYGAVHDARDTGEKPRPTVKDKEYDRSGVWGRYDHSIRTRQQHDETDALQMETRSEEEKSLGSRFQKSAGFSQYAAPENFRNFAYRSEKNRIGRPNSFRENRNIAEAGETMHHTTSLRGNTEEEAVLELFQKTKMSTGINFAHYSKIPVNCVPNNIQPWTGFNNAQLPPSLLENIDRAGYITPTPIQQYALPIVLRGKDLMACAQTGSGKTAAFLVPIIADILENGKGRLPMHLRQDPHYRGALPVALVLGPTRELVLQIHDEARKFCFRTELRSVICYGGVELPPQMAELRRGADLVVATPGRLWDLYNRQTVHFACTRFVVLDEADRMLDLGFGEQIDQILKDSDMPSTGDRQTLMFSATFPLMIQTLAKNYLANYYFVTVGRVGSTTEGITQRVELVEGDRKLTLTRRLLQKDPEALTLIFVETKRAADELMISLSNDGISVATLHGDRSQREREEALRLFRSGEISVLVATDVASRGLDIPNVSHVIQYDMPSAMDDYIHRIGRTGRAGNVGLATAFFQSSDTPLANELLEILKEHNQTVPEWLPDIVMRATQQRVKSTYRNHGSHRRRH